MAELIDVIHERFPRLIEDAIAFGKLPKRCKADLHELAPGHRGGCPFCATAARLKRSARAEQGAR